MALNLASARLSLHAATPTELQPIIARSNHWARIKSEVVCSMTSKYAIKLHELIQLRGGLRKCIETIPIDRFRELIGVPPGKLERGNDFARFVIEPASLEVNGLSDYGVSIDLIREKARGPITAVSLAWWKKEGEQYREVLRVNRRQDGAPWRHEERVPGSVQRHCCLQSMVEHFSCWAGPVKPEAAVGGGPKGLA